MNGWWAQKPNRCRPRFLLCLVVSGAATLAGCRETREYDGMLPDGLARLTVVNQTPWPCDVGLKPRQKPPIQATTIRSRLAPGDEYTWDLMPGTYDITALRIGEPIKRLRKSYDAEAGIHCVWPLLERRAIGMP